MYGNGELIYIFYLALQGSPTKSAHSSCRSRRSRHATPRRGPTPACPGLARAQSTESSLAMIGTNGGAGAREDLEDLDGLEFTMNSNGHI